MGTRSRRERQRLVVVGVRQLHDETVLLVHRLYTKQKCLTMTKNIQMTKTNYHKQKWLASNTPPQTGKTPKIQERVRLLLTKGVLQLSVG